MSNLKDLLKKELQDKCLELKIEFTDDDNKSELIERILKVEPVVEQVAPPVVEPVAKKKFDRESYDTFVRLTFEKGIRKGGQLNADEVKTLNEVKPKAFKNEGLKPLVTNSYRVNMKSVQLVEGLPTPADVVAEFSDEGKKKLFV